jgi:predicted small secreted protein
LTYVSIGVTINCRLTLGDYIMKAVIAVILALSLTGCGTLGGAVSGAGDDLKKVGGWVQRI